MKKMSFWETTTPVGSECLYPTELEAQSFFKQQHLNGELTFGVGITDHMEKDLLWLLQTPTGLVYPLWAFKQEKEIKGNLSLFHPESEGSYIHRHQYNYRLCKDDMLGLTIRELTIFSDETDIKALFHITGQTYEEIALVQVYASMIDLTPIFTCWLVTLPNNTASMHPTFLEDILIHKGFNPQEATWNFLEVGDTFYHFNDKFRVNFDHQTGWYFSKVFHNPYMKIYKKNAI